MEKLKFAQLTIVGTPCGRAAGGRGGFIFGGGANGVRDLLWARRRFWSFARRNGKIEICSADDSGDPLRPGGWHVGLLTRHACSTPARLATEIGSEVCARCGYAIRIRHAQDDVPQEQQGCRRRVRIRDRPEQGRDNHSAPSAARTGPKARLKLGPIRGGDWVQSTTGASSGIAAGIASAARTEFAPKPDLNLLRSALRVCSEVRRGFALKLVAGLQAPSEARPFIVRRRYPYRDYHTK